MLIAGICIVAFATMSPWFTKKTGPRRSRAERLEETRRRRANLERTRQSVLKNRAV